MRATRRAARDDPDPQIHAKETILHLLRPLFLNIITPTSTTRSASLGLGSAAIKRSQSRGLPDRPRTSSSDQTRASPESNLGVQWLCPCHPRCLHGFRLLPVTALPSLKDPRLA